MEPKLNTAVLKWLNELAAAIQANDGVSVKWDYKDLQDLQSGRHQIRVVQGKGRKDRYTLLSPRLLEELRRYWPSLNCTLLACVSADGLARVKFAGPEAFWRCC